MWTMKIAIRGGKGDAILIGCYIPWKGDGLVFWASHEDEFNE